MEWEKGSLFLQAAFIEIKSHKSLSMLAASRCMRPAAGGKKKAVGLGNGASPGGVGRGMQGKEEKLFHCLWRVLNFRWHCTLTHEANCLTAWGAVHACC